MKTINFNLIVLAVFCLSGIKSCSARHLNRYREFIEAFNLALNFTSMLVGNDVTEEDIKEFEKGSELEDVRLAIDRLIEKHGYKVEKYNVITEDGYILQLFRIPSSGRPVLLMHGLLLSSDDFVTPGPESGMAYLLAAEGLDVWLGNVRGNKYSQRHVRLSPNSADFWDFSWDEMGRYDLPAIVDHILNVTQHSQLTYIGHSQGGCIYYVMGSERPEYNKKIALMIGLAPASTVKHLKNPIFEIWSLLNTIPSESYIEWFRKIGFSDPLPIRNNIFLDFLATVVCRRFEITKSICSNYVFLGAGYNLSSMNVTTLPAVLSHSPSGTSLKLLEHFAQTITTGKFTKYNYDAKKNIMLYGMRTPPEYDLESIPTPVAIIYSRKDWLVTEPDVLYLRSKLNNVMDLYRVPSTYQYNHLNFLYGKDIKTVILPKILKLIKSIDE